MRVGKTLALCAVLLLCSGCAYAAVTAQQTDNDYGLYFQEKDLGAAPGGDVLRAETIYVDETKEPQLLAETLLTELLKGPLDETLRSPIPTGVSLLSVEVEGGRALVDLSSGYGTLSGVGLTLADYAITLTLTQVPEIFAVRITVRGRELAYRDRQMFTERDVLRTSMEDVVGTVEATLYFPDANGHLVAEERTLDLYEGETQAAAVAKALAAGPETKELLAAMPESFRVKSIWLEEDVCYVNLPSIALPDLEPAALELAFQALTKSLGSLDTVREVSFLVDGEFADTYGTMAVAAPFLP